MASGCFWQPNDGGSKAATRHSNTNMEGAHYVEFKRSLWASESHDWCSNKGGMIGVFMDSSKDMLSLDQGKEIKEHHDNPRLKVAEMVRQNTFNDGNILQNDGRKETIIISKLSDVSIREEYALELSTKQMDSNGWAPMKAHVQPNLVQTNQA
ncbi:hypothetical protein SLE2022_210340 [Rubroshorea leprosula]